MQFPALITSYVIDDFLARGADELTLRRGDKVELLELDEGFGDGWYLGKHVAENRTGLFPGGKNPLLPSDVVIADNLML